MKLAFVGPSQCGKGTATKHLANRYSFISTGSCSSVLAPHVAAKMGISVEQAYATRHLYSDYWDIVATLLRREDPAYLARRTLNPGDICDGVRDRGEIQTVRAEGMVDLIIWIERDVPVDNKLKFGPEEADLIIENKGSVAEFHLKLDRLAATWGRWPGKPDRGQ